MTLLMRALAVFFSFAALSTQVYSKPINGEAAPLFSGIGLDGSAVRLEDFRGRYVVLEWTNHECPYVLKHYNSGNMQKTQRALTEDDVVWLSVISSAPGKQGYVSADKARELTTTRGSYADDVILDADGTIGRLYDAKTTPHMFLIDPEGTLLYQGAIDDIPSASIKTLDKATNLVLVAWSDVKAGRAIVQANSKPYGCSVKY
jgi:hypothetical protein